MRNINSIIFLVVRLIVFALIACVLIVPRFVIADEQKNHEQKNNTPQKIASLNLCLDALLLALVDRPRIDSLTYLSGNPQFSPFADQTKGIYLNRGLAEDLVPRKPDLILAGDFGAADAVTLLQQLGFNVVRMPLPRTVDDITAHIRHFGTLVGSENAAEKMAKNIEQQLELMSSMQQAQHQKITAFWYSSNGVVVGADTLENELMQRAGFYNLALDKHINGFATLNLEEIILAQPQVIIIESSDTNSFSLAQEYVHHPALHNQQTKIIQLPATLSTCSAPVVADVIKALRNSISSL